METTNIGGGHLPKKASNKVNCEYFAWNILNRQGMAYADGRQNKPSLGKHSLGVRHADTAAVLDALRQVDRVMASKRGLVAMPCIVNSSRPITIQAGWTQYMEHCRRSQVLGGVSESTAKRYRAVSDKHQEFCAAHAIEDWAQIDKKSVEKYATWLARKNYADASIYLECTLLKQIVKWFIEQGLLSATQRINLTLHRSSESDTYCYTREQVAAMIDFCNSTQSLQWLAVLITALAATGLRIAEAIGLRWSDVDLVNNIITLSDNRRSGQRQKKKDIRTTKGRRSRRIPIYRGLHRVLASLPHHLDNHVFHGPRGGTLKADTVRNILVRDVLTPLSAKFPTHPGDIGFIDGRLHSFRHYFVSQCFLGGVSEGEIREWVGHADSRIVERYRHLSDDDAQRKMRQLNLLETNLMTTDQTLNTTTSGAGKINESRDAEAVGCSDGPHSSQNPKRGALSEADEEMVKNPDAA